MAGTKKSPLLPILILLSALAVFEIFNFATTEAALTDIFGSAKFFTFSIATWFALGACFTDIGGLYRIFTAETSMKKESQEVKRVFVAWIFAAIINAGLTFWFVSIALERRNGPIPSVLRGNEVWIAVAIALFVFVMRFGLISALGHVGEKFALPSLPKRNRYNKSRSSAQNLRIPTGMNITPPSQTKKV